SLVVFVFFLFFSALRVLHSFPTRRSSDLCSSIWSLRPLWVPACSTTAPLSLLPPPSLAQPARRARDAARAMESFFMTSIALAASDRKSTRLNSSHLVISYAVFCLKKKKKN